MALFTGSGVAIVTPFKKDMSIDFEKLEHLIDFHMANKTDSIIICGTTGEASTLTDEEQLECIKVTVDRVNKRIPVIAGVGSNDTNHGIELSKKADALGADGLLHVTPYYNKTSQKGLVEHFNAMAHNVDIPIVLYNVPSRTGMNIAPDTAATLSKTENIVAIKEASGNIGHIVELVQKCEGRLDLYSGNDDQILPLLSLGGLGVISVIANILPKETHDIVDLYISGKHKESLALHHRMHPLMQSMFCDVNPIPVKAALSLMGTEFDPGTCRLPLTSLEPASFERIKNAMLAYGMKI